VKIASSGGKNKGLSHPPPPFERENLLACFPCYLYRMSETSNRSESKIEYSQKNYQKTCQAVIYFVVVFDVEWG
jgi:hypothetical protein